ncbi:MAG: HDOD domain-containing protein [Ignavibacteria bacterium]|jgi:putative nucleotidyltransferase with HDIG domain
MLHKVDFKSINQKRESTRKELLKINKISSVPKIITQLLEIINEPDPDITKAKDLINKDQGLVTKILKIANSPFYGLVRKVNTLDMAFLVVGFEDIKSLVIAISLVENFMGKNDAQFKQEDFWLHSYLTGMIAKELSIFLHLNIEGEARIAGLLHDIGIAIIHKHLNNSYRNICNIIKTSEKNLFEIEFEELGYTHQEIGAILLQKWNFPDNICNAILYHHFPEKNENMTSLLAVLHFAEYISQKFNNDGFYEKSLNLNSDVLGILNINSTSEINEIIKKIENDLEDQIPLMKAGF